MRRHDLVYLRASAAFETLCVEAGSPFWLAARDWIAHGRPLVAARQPATAPGVLLGLTLPSHSERKRLTIKVDRSSIVAVQPPLAIGRCLALLPVDAAAVLGELESRINGSKARIGIFGSLAWEALSGETYRHAASDIDIICDVATPAQFKVALAALQQTAAELPCALDGEIRFPDGNAVAWREILANLERPKAAVLVKGNEEVRLMPLRALTASLSPERRYA
ncbi:MAG: malonate decarboxylase holo-[acyl-carrier-protein] synthase [Betaproteobacteria bacterium HGW-Betaproteobacteria-10]|nr:MAG: malonate decarboxylase holo-[acyl-carrier-protein] synthase [Betaproteobacteria bacterium HGW-Betaproteobacteria-10]